MNLRGAKPVSDLKIKNFIQALNPTSDLYNLTIQETFVNNFFNWINSSKLNNLTGLEKFSNRQLVSGTSQAFDHFYWRHKSKCFRMFRGEFMYHSAVLKHGGVWKYIDDDQLTINDAVIISIPFSDYGKQRNDTITILEKCNSLNIPVLLDFAYYPCTKNIKIDLDLYPCVETATFSISKAFYGAEFLRVGMRLERKYTDDGIDVFNSVEMVNRMSISIANSLIDNYSVDHNWRNYSEAYEKVCANMDLQSTDCIMFGLGNSKYNEFNRGTEVNRVCISELIGEEISV